MKDTNPFNDPFRPPPQGETRNSKVLADFVAYCNAHPNERFWQALRNWSGYAWIWASFGGTEKRDTFFWEGRNE